MTLLGSRCDCATWNRGAGVSWQPGRSVAARIAGGRRGSAMDRGRRFKSACQSPACGDREAARMLTSFHGTHKRWRRAAPGLVLFCLIALFGFPARAQAGFEDKLAPQDTVEVRIWRWTALRGGVAEALALSKTFTIG